ncbi:MAG: hypothetical protein IJC50_07825 [Clostridia bacterium]|nr:hypothetical protein [Clostridia bacterium]
MNTVDFKNASWIWGEDNTTPDQKIVFRTKFELEDIPETADTYISCDTKFWLWINEKEVVWEGGVFRESTPGNGWAEKIDIAPYLKRGENVVAVLAWFYGNGGRNNSNSGEAGFIMNCEAIGLSTGENFVCAAHPAYIKSGEPRPAYLFGGDNIAFDAHLDFGDFTAEDFNEIEFVPSTVYENKVWGESLVSELPLLKVGEITECDFETTETGIVADLPYAMTVSVCFEAKAKGGEVIDIRTDRYNINGGPGDEFHNYNGHRIEYICKEGENKFVCPMYLYGEKLIATYPETVKMKMLGYRESGYDTDFVGSFTTDNEIFNKLIEKSIRTLYVCMRNNFMDCPDRERGQWIGDVSVQAPQVFFVFDEKAKKLLKKSILDFIRLRKGDVLVGNVPGEHFSELPSQSLVAISEFGLLAEYYNYSLDCEIPELVLEPIVNYLKLWELNDKGLLVGRDGNWRWFDHLWNVDEDVLENCLYVSACKFALRMADLSGNHKYDDFLTERAQSLTKLIEENYWKGEYYSSKDFVDDRANAIAVLSGICPPERYPAIRKILLTVFNSTPYMERFVLCALCEMGYIRDAYNRMMSRYYNLAVNDNSTLWEDFFILGTRNHAWTGSPVEIAFKYILGFKTNDGFNTYTVDPIKDIFGKVDCSFNLNGKVEKLHFDCK